MCGPNKLCRVKINPETAEKSLVKHNNGICYGLIRETVTWRHGRLPSLPLQCGLRNVHDNLYLEGISNCENSDVYFVKIRPQTAEKSEVTCWASRNVELHYTLDVHFSTVTYFWGRGWAAWMGGNEWINEVHLVPLFLFFQKVVLCHCLWTVSSLSVPSLTDRFSLVLLPKVCVRNWHPTLANLW